MENSLYVSPPEGYTGSNRWQNWHGYRVEVGGGYAPHLLNELQAKRDNIEACIVAVTGGGGKGKTYFALRCAQILDKNFNVEVQVPFGTDELLTLISSESPLKMGQVIIVDESQFAMSSREWYADIQRTLMKQLEAIRSKGFIIFIVALSEATLDVIARNFVITHKIHLTKRGHARCYKYSMSAFSTKPYPTTISKDCTMALPDAEFCESPSCLNCQYSGLGKTLWKRRNKWEEKGDIICQTIRARYERKKKLFLESVVDEATDKRKENKANEETKKLTVEDVVELMKQNSAELILNSHGNINKEYAYTLVKKHYNTASDRMINKAVGILSQDSLFCSNLSFKKNTIPSQKE